LAESATVSRWTRPLGDGEVNTPVSSPFDEMHHLCIVVHDLERTVALFESLGVGPWHDYPPMDEYTTLEVPDTQDFLKLEIKWTQIGAMQVQVVAPPPGNTRQRRFLEEHGEGVFHLGFVVDDVEQGQTDALSRGLEVLMRGRRDDGSGFTYFDTADKGAAVTLSIRQSKRPSSQR
jgi:methylmalonyl-CoA/ethylmalonyl-CoA epimerase